MTRLIEEWIINIRTTIKEYESDLISKTGMDLVALASYANDVSQKKIVEASKNIKIGVIPITTGLGVIGSFSESVAAILHCMNFEVFITEKPDVTGILEAHQRGAQIIFLADDDKFIAVNLQDNIISDNNKATARGYVAALEGAAGALTNREVLVIGCGTVGRKVLCFLKEKGADPVAYDINRSVLTNFKDKGFQIISDINKIGNYLLIIDASCEGGWINKSMLHREAWIVTPGVPISLDEEAYELHKDRIIHDYLPIGVATMLAEVCR